MSPDSEVLVTGAAGFIGRHAVRAFREAGYQVTALDLRKRPNRLVGVTRWLCSDFAADDILAEIEADRYITVVHQGGISDTRIPAGRELNETNTFKVLRLADACRRSGTRLIYASSHAVYGTLYRHLPIAENADEDRSRCSGPLNPYATSKLELDRQMRLRYATGLEWVGLRYTNIVGPDEADKGPMASIMSQLLRQAAETGHLRIFDDSLTAARDYLPVDTVAATLVYLTSTSVRPGVYNLGSGHAVSFAQIAQWCARWHRETGDDPLKVELVPNPVASAYQYFTCADMTALATVFPGCPTFCLKDTEAWASGLFRLFRSALDRIDTPAGSVAALAPPDV
jgi:ADP-L-glycero-D-manno-heptose 6-epimerase